MLPERIELTEIGRLLPNFGSSIMKRYLFENISPEVTRRLRADIETAVRAEAPHIARAYEISVGALPDQNTFKVVLTERSAVDRLADLAS